MSSDNPKTRDTLSVGDRVWVGGSQRPGFGAVKSISPSRDSAELTMDSGGRFIVWTYSVVPILTPGDTCDAPPHPGRYKDCTGDVEHIVWSPRGLRLLDGCIASEWAAMYAPLTYLGPLDAEPEPAPLTPDEERALRDAWGTDEDAEVEVTCPRCGWDRSPPDAPEDPCDMCKCPGVEIPLDAEQVRPDGPPTTTIFTAEVAALRTAARRLDEVCDVLGCDEAAVVELAQRLADDEHRTLGDDRWTPQEVARALRALADDMDGEGAIAVTDAALSFALGEVTRG